MTLVRAYHLWPYDSCHLLDAAGEPVIYIPAIAPGML